MAKVGTPGAIKAPSLQNAFLGQSVSFPLALTSTGRLALSQGVQSVNDSLIAILTTQPNEMPMMPSLYGANVGVFEPIDSSVMEIAFRTSVAMFEPRVASIDSFQRVIGRDGLSVIVNIQYTVIGKSTADLVTYPYFQGPQ